jgi:uncharacterized protein (DUF1800 family)
MNRRSFLESTSKSKLRTVEVLPAIDQAGGISKFANKTLPTVARSTAGIEPYSGPWGQDQVAHLLRRTMFGATKSDIQSMLALTMSQAVNQLLLDSPAPNPPVNTSSTDIDVPIGQTWVNSPKLDSNGNNPDGGRRTSLKSWWIGLMLGQQVSLRERMTLFWHNNFVTEADVVSDARFSYKYLALLRQ